MTASAEQKQNVHLKSRIFFERTAPWECEKQPHQCMAQGAFAKYDARQQADAEAAKKQKADKLAARQLDRQRAKANAAHGPSAAVLAAAAEAEAAARAAAEVGHALR